ncbi:MAG: MFS family permease [Candidatus Latescibacterota bacterium]|jgi:MFS family permease
MTLPSNPLTEWNRNFALLALAVAGVGMFFGVQLTLFNNFIVEGLGVEAHELGYVEALREVPGFLNVLFFALLVRFSPSRVATAALVVMGVGIAVYTYASTIYLLAIFSVIWSLGFHCWIPLEQSMALAYAPTGERGRWLGQLRSVGSIAWLLAIGLCMLLMDYIHYEGLFVLAGVATIAGGIALLFVNNKGPKIRDKSMVFKRRYSLYYALNFLQGLRKQMFITFAIFALVKVHGMPVKTTMILVMINQVFITLTGPLMGRLVDRHGERKMLSVSYVVLVFVFLGYAIVEHRPTLYALYCIDNLIFFGGIALTTYAHKIAPADELKPTLSMGVTMNHVASVAAPLIGGLAWMKFGYQVIFFSGAALAFISLIVSQWVDPEGQLEREEKAGVLAPVAG